MTMKLNRTAGRKLLSLLLTLCVMLSLLPAITPTARASNVNKRTNALDLSGAYLTYQTGSGTAVANPTAQDIDAAAEGWSWAFGTKTLTLSGVDFGGIEYVALPGNSTIVLTGGSTNTLIPVGTQVVKYGIYCGGNLTVRGAGSLEVAGVAGGTESRALWLAGTLTIEDGTLDFHGESAQSGSYGIYAGGSVVITGGYLLTSGDSSNNGGYGIFASQSISVAGGTVTAKGNYALQAISGIVLTGMSAMQKDTYLGYCVPVSVGGGMLQYSGGMIATDVLITPSPVSAAISNLTLSGGVGIALTGTNEVTLTLSGATFSGVSANNVVSSWFTNLPAGLVATVDTVAGDGTTVTVAFSGTPTTASGEVMAITIPGGMLSMGANVAVTSNNNAKFAVTQPTAARTSGLDLTASTVAYLDQYGTSVSANPTAESITDTGEGWAWYLTATGDNAAKTLVLSGIDLSTPEITGLKLPAGATIVLVEGSENTVVSTYSSDGSNNNATRGIWAIGALTIQGAGTLNATGGDASGGNSNGASGDSAGLATTTTNAHLTIKDGAVVNATSGLAARNSWGIYAVGRLSNTNATVTGIGGDGQSYSMGIQVTTDIVVSGSGGTVTAKAGVSPNRRSVQSLLGGSILTPLMQVRQWNEGENAYSTEVTVGSTGTGSQVTYINGNDPADNIRITPCPPSFSGEGTETAPYLISTKAQLEEMEARVNAEPDTYADKHYALTTDIELNQVLNGDFVGEPDQWTPMGSVYNPFTGVFDGRGHTIIGLYIYKNDPMSSGPVGLFGKLSGATVRDVGLLDGSLMDTASDSAVGAVAGISADGSLIDGCYSTVMLRGQSVGGIAGLTFGTNENTNFPSTVVNCYNTGSIFVQPGGTGGGIAGENKASARVLNCYNTGSVMMVGQSNTASVGGVIGTNIAVVRNCYNTGTVTAIVAGAVIGNNTGSGHARLYWMENTATHALGNDEDDSGLPSRTQAEMRGVNFLNLLNQNVETDSESFSDLDFSTWASDSATTPANNGYPVFGTPIPSMGVSGVVLSGMTLGMTDGGNVTTIHVVMQNLDLTTGDFAVMSNTAPAASVTDVTYASGMYTLTINGMSMDDNYTLTITKEGYVTYTDSSFYGTPATADDIDIDPEHEQNIFDTFTRSLSAPGVLTIQNNTFAVGATLYSGSVYDAIDGNNGYPDNGTIARVIGSFAVAPEGAMGVKTLRSDGQMTQVNEDYLIDGNPNYQETVADAKAYNEAHQNDPGFTPNTYVDTVYAAAMYSTVATARQQDLSRVLQAPVDRFRIIAWYDNEACIGTPIKVVRLLTQVVYTGDQTSASVQPTVTSVTPGSGSVDGGTSVTINGTDFGGATAVTIGGAAATNVTLVSPTQITATVPAGAGTADVSVASPGGTGTGSGLYTYVAQTATPTASVAAGGIAAGTPVTLSCATDGATIYYTSNGGTPTSGSSVYSTPISVSTAVIIKAIAVKSGMYDSAVMSVSYTILPALPAPANLAWSGTTASWNAVDNAASYSVQLYRDGSAVGEAISVTSGTTHDFASAISVAGGYTFKVTAVGDGETYADSAASAASAAQNYYSVTYWANDGATGSVPVDRKVYASGATVTVRGNPGGLARPGYTFSGWSDGETTYTAGQTFTISENTILYASWTASAATHTVTFMDNYPGGSTFLTRNNIQTGALLSGLSAPSRADYTFTGWYRDAACMIPWDTGMAVTANLTLYAGWTANPLHSVSGHVENTSGGNVSGATVRIFKGNTQIGNTAATLTDGSFTVSNVPDGAYNVVVKKDDQQVTHFITVSGGDYTFSGSIVLPDGKKNSVLDIVGTDTPPVVANGVNELFTDSSIFDSTDADIVSGSGTVEIRLTVQPSEDTAGQTTVQAAISSGGYSSGTLLDLELTKTSTDAGGNVQTQTAINETTDPLTLIIPLPAALQGKENYVIYRAHDHGSGLIADAITTTANASGEYIAVNSEKTQITLYAKFFSTYAIAYSTGSSETPTTGGSGTSYRVTVEGTLIGGSISPSGSISVAKGGSKTFTITPDKGYVISDVLVDGKSVGAVSSYTLSNITAAHALSAVFAKATGLPYYYVDDSKVFIGFASDDSGEMKYLAPEGETVLFVPNPKEFTDISGHWGKDAIDFVTQREIFMGTGTKVFSPDTGMTRAMLATVIGRLYERSYGTLTTTGAQSFADCDYNSWYGAYIDWCAEQGIIQGVGGDQFEPDRQVTRQEMAAMLYRFAEFLEVNESGLDGETLGYSDAASIADWAQAAALYCQETGIITGRNGGSFAPAQTATRAEVATILERFIELVV